MGIGFISSHEVRNFKIEIGGVIMNETELTLKEIIERFEYMYGMNIESDEKYSEYAMRSILNDIYTADIFNK